MQTRVLYALATLGLCAVAAVTGVWIAESRTATSQPAGAFAGAVRPPGARAPDFRLRDQDGKPVAMADYRGRTVVMTFVYSTCKDTCPAQVQSIRGALDKLGHDVPVLAVSVDPANDTPDSAERFLVKQSMSAGRMRFLLGTRAQLQPIWKAYGIRPQGKGFEHTAYVAVLDQTGRQRVAFTIDHLTDRDLAHDIRKLESERA